MVAGGWNTLFGYFVGVGLYYIFSPLLHVAVIGLIGGVLSITMSFLAYKLFVFRTSGNWLLEYSKCYAVYGATALLSVGILWGLVNYYGQPFWIAQGFAILITVIVSYLGHSRFTFRGKPKSIKGHKRGKKKAHQRHISVLQRRRKRRRSF